MRPLTIKQKALLFMELSRLEQSGLPRLKALSILSEGHSEVSKRAAAALRLSRLNVSFPKAAAQSGLVDKNEQALLELADKTAQYEQVFSNLENLYQTRYLQNKQLFAQLLLPAAVFILALFISPLPQLINNSLTVADYLSGIFWTILKLIVLISLLIKLPKWLEHGSLGNTLKSVYDYVSLKIPVYSRLYIQGIVLNYFSLLVLSLKSGMPIIDALKLTEKNISNRIIRKTFAKIPGLINQGMTFSDAVREAVDASSVIDIPEIQHAINAGDYSGSLESSIENIVIFLNEFHQQNINTFFQWLPRIIYFLVLLFMANSLI